MYFEKYFSEFSENIFPNKISGINFSECIFQNNVSGVYSEKNFLERG